MSWLDLSSSSNRFIRMYVQGFVDISGGNLIIRNSDISLNGSFYQSTYNGFSMPGLTAIYKYPSLVYNPNDTATSFISSNVTITAGNSSTTSNTYTLGNSISIIVGNIYVPRYANVAIAANIPMGYDLSMLVQNANIYYGNNTYSNTINSPSSSSVYSNVTLLTTTDVVKGNCSYSLNSMVIPIGLNLSGTMVYNTPSNLSSNSSGNSVSYYSNISAAATAVNTQQLVANIAVPPYYMGNAISVYTPVAANIFYSIATTAANIARSTSANVSLALTGIYANIYQNGTQWGNVTLLNSTIYGNFTFTNSSSTANITTGNVLKANVYLTTGNVSFVPEYSNTISYYTVKYYLTSTYTTYNSVVIPKIELNSPMTSGNIGNITFSGNSATNTTGSFTSNTYYTGGIASSYSTNSTLGSDVNVTYLSSGSYSLANYTNKIANNLKNYYTTLTTMIPYIYAVNSNNNIIQTFTNNTDYSSNFVSSFLYFANQTYNSQTYNANVFLGNINIPSTTLLKDASDNASTIKFMANVNVAYSYTSNINTLGTAGNISYLTIYSNPSTTTNSISGNINFYNAGTSTSLSQTTSYPLSGNIQLNKSTLAINSNIANIVIYDGANNYIDTIPSSSYTLTSTNTSGNNYTIKYGNIAVNSNVYLKNIIGTINISNYSLPINYGSDMSYSLNVVFKSNVVVPHTANISNYRYYANISNSPVIGNVTYLESSTTSDYVSYSLPITNNSPPTYGNVYINKLYVANDVFFNSNLSVASDTSLNGKLTVASDTSLNGKLTVASDASLNGKLTVASDASFNGNSTIGNILTVKKTGYLGIGTSAPTNFLQIAGNTSTFAATAPDNGSNHNLLLTSTKTYTSSSPYSMSIGVDYSSGAGYINAAGSGTYQPVCLNTRGGNVGIGTTSPDYTLEVSGTVGATSYNATSDYRIKANIIPLSDTSFSVDLLRPVTYMNTSLGKSDIGFIAHEVQEQFPFLVTGEKDETNYQTLNYTGLIGLLTKEIQDLKKEIKEIRRELASYKP